MMYPGEYLSHEAFWPDYVRGHSQPLNRQLHFAGNTNLLFWLILALLRRSSTLFVFAILSSYAIAWIGHFFIEENVPLTFRYPLMSAICDMRMYFKMWNGSMDAEVARYVQVDQTASIMEADWSEE